jgi:uroporphyrinogen decarboxylase
MHRWMQVAEVDEVVLRRFGIDTRRLSLGKGRNPLERDLDGNSYVDPWGVVRSRPAGGLYFDVKTSPLAGEISIHDILHYPWPSAEDPGITDGLRSRAEALRKNAEHAIVVTLPSAFVHHSQFLRGFEDWFADFIAGPRLLEALFDAVLAVNLATTQFILREVGDLVDIVVTADDIGDQRGTIVSPAMYRQLIKPRQRRSPTTLVGPW